jgi:type I restriction enzyme S subunit
MELRPGYKLSQLGPIPDDWQVVHLSELGETKRGASSQYIRYRNSGGVRLIRINDFFENNAVFVEPTDKMMTFCITERDLLFAGTGASAGASFLPEVEWIGLPHSYNAPRIRVFQNQCKEYLLYSLQSKYVLRQQKAWFVGNAQPFLDTKAISGFSIAIPPNVGEQCTIAGALGDVDALLAELEKLIAKKRDLKQAAMQELLTGKKRLPGFKGEWAAKTLKQLGDISGAGVDKKIRPNEVAVRLVNYLDVYKRDFIYSRDLYHIVSAPLEQANRCLVKKGDVFFTPSSEVPNDIGVSAVAMEDIPDAVYSYHVVRLRLPEDWDLKYRAYAFKSRQFLDQAERLCEGSGIRYVLTQARFRQLTVLVPPTTQEQAAIGTILFDMDAEIAALEQRREKTYALKQGMMQELLTGQTRLV